jgi:hypothetical protein
VAKTFATSSPRLGTPTFSKTAFTWSRTVCGEMKSLAAISEVPCPRAISRVTSSSR